MAVSLLEARRSILLNTPHIESASGSIATFSTDLSANLKECKIHFLPVQEGTGDPSPDNVRPITGWDGVTVIKTGKNLANLNESEMLSYGWTKAFPNPFRKPGKYTISCQNTIVTGSQSGSFVFLRNAVTDSSGYVLTGWTFGKSVMSVSFNITAEALEKKYIVFRFNAPPNYASISNAQIQIEEGLEATEYEIPPLEIPISFGRTIYGGYVDLVNGEVVEEYVAVTLDGVNVKVNYGSYPSDNFYGGGWIYTNPLGISRNSGKTYFCDKLCYGANSATIPHYQTPYGGNLYYMLRVLPKADYPDGLTTTEVRDLTNEWLQQNPVTVVYPLKASNSYSLTPQTLKALKGINNIWSDANGNVEVKFWKH